MSATDEEMSKLTPIQIHAILSKGEWTNAGKLKIRSSHSTDELLKRAGIAKPIPLETYELSVRRNDESGLLGLNPFSGRVASLPVASDNDLTEKGGIFYDPKTELEKPASKEEQAEVFQEILHGRTFELILDGHTKIRFVVLRLEDEALPSPNEPECWKAHKATDEEIRSCAQRLSVAQNLTQFEK